MLNLTAGGLSGGYRKYVQQLVPLMRASAQVDDLLMVVPPGFEEMPGIGAGAISWRAGEHWRGYPSLRERVRAWKPDVVFVPTARFLDCGAPAVCMVRNMEPMLPPTLADGAVAFLKSRAGATLARRACQSSTRVIAVSNFVRDFVVNKWRLAPSRVGVVYHGVNPVTTPYAESVTAATLPEGPYVFAAGSLLRYRGLEDVVRALVHTDIAVKLVVAGTGSAAYESHMRALAEQLGVSSRVVWMGQANEEQMGATFARCMAFVMTSRVEACPNTALEAMASGAICISTRCAPMPEFFGDNALYYDAGDAETLARQINSASTMPVEAAETLCNGGRERAREFSWERTLSSTMDELRLASGIR